MLFLSKTIDVFTFLLSKTTGISLIYLNYNTVFSFIKFKLIKHI